MQLSEPRAPLIKFLYHSNAQRFIGLVLPSILEMIEVLAKQICLTIQIARGRATVLILSTSPTLSTIEIHGDVCFLSCNFANTM